MDVCRKGRDGEITISELINKSYFCKYFRIRLAFESSLQQNDHGLHFFAPINK